MCEFVIPAQAGTQLENSKLGSRLRGNDITGNLAICSG